MYVLYEYISIHIFVYRFIRTHMFTRIYAYIVNPNPLHRGRAYKLYIYLHICMYVPIYIHVSTFIDTKQSDVKNVRVVY